MAFVWCRMRLFHPLCTRTAQIHLDGIVGKRTARGVPFVDADIGALYSSLYSGRSVVTSARVAFREVGRLSFASTTA